MRKNKFGRKYGDAIKSIEIRVKKDRAVSTYYYRSKNPNFARYPVGRKVKYTILVRYRGGWKNESVWYDTKRELRQAFRCFTEPSLLKEFL